MSELYNLVLFPTVKEGFDEAEVKAMLSVKLKVDAEKIEAWFASDKPTLLLKDVQSDVADRYLKAIIECGGTCNMQPTSGGGHNSLSLEPKRANQNIFKCPSCEYNEELPPGETYERCPSCNLVMAKWAEKQAEERKKAEIRRRLMRDAKFKEDRENALKRKEDELAELQRLEAEIMKELGIKPPSKMWQMFAKRPFSISISVGLLLVTASSVASFYVSDYLDAEQEAKLAAEPASEEIQQLAPSMAGAVGLQLSGNQDVVDELAAATQMLGGQMIDKEMLVAATEQMMKGAGSDQFVQQANAAQSLKSSTPGGLGEPPPVAVNRDTIGGVEGLPGVSGMSETELAASNPGASQQGQDEVKALLTHKLQLPDPANPNGPDILVDQIERLDASGVVQVIKSLERDHEWDSFLHAQVLAFVKDDRIDQAYELVDRMKVPNLKAQAMIAAIRADAKNNPNQNFKMQTEQASTVLKAVPNADSQAMYWLELGDILSLANVESQPSKMFSRVESMAAKKPAAEQSMFLSRLAAAHVGVGDTAAAKRYFNQAMRVASQAETTDRIRAFSAIANRYYDVRNLTVAGEIISEALIVAATELKTAERVPALMAIAAAQSYQGDIVGALKTVENAARGEARDQLLGQLAAWLIDEDQIFKAQTVMAEINSVEQQYQLASRLIAQVVNHHGTDKAVALLLEYTPRSALFEDETEAALMLSRFGRLHLRVNQISTANQLFGQAKAIVDQLFDRKADVTRSIVALDEARGLRVGDARRTLSKVQEVLVAEPVAGQILTVERTILNLLPDTIRQRALSTN